MWCLVGDITEDVEVDVESIVFDCVDSDGLSVPHADADHCYSSVDKSWLWRRQNELIHPTRRRGRGGSIPKRGEQGTMEGDVAVQLSSVLDWRGNFWHSLLKRWSDYKLHGNVGSEGAVSICTEQQLESLGRVGCNITRVLWVRKVFTPRPFLHVIVL